MQKTVLADPETTSPVRGFAGFETFLSDVRPTASSKPSQKASNADKDSGSYTSPVPSNTLGEERPGDRGLEPSSKTAAVRVNSDSSAGTWVALAIGVCFLAVIGWLTANSGSIGTSNAPQVADAPAYPTPAPVPLSPPAPAIAPQMAVAAINANVRKESNARSKPISTLARGSMLQPLEEANGFLRIRLPDGRDGWISRDVTVAFADALRLRGLSASDYSQARIPLKGIETLFEQLMPHQDLLIRALYQVGNESPDVDATLREIANTVRLNIAADVDASLWFSLEAKSLADKQQVTEALASARAAVLANPSNADLHIALAYAANSAEDFKTLNSVAMVLPLLAPSSTNTWVIEGISAANSGSATLIDGSFALAIRLSRNPKVTARVLSDLASRSKDARVSDAITKALSRWETKP